MLDLANRTPKRTYEKGEGRTKHLGRSAEPEIEMNRSNPKSWIGKCPNNMSVDTRQKILDSAIPGPTEDEGEVPQNLYAVHEGAIYEAMSSDHGTRWHGYPFKGKLSRKMIGRLRELAREQKCEQAFDQWVKKHIEEGRRR